MRRLSLLAVVAALLFVPASTALARGDGWEPVPADDVEGQFCDGVNFFIDFTANKEYGRVVTLGGQDVFQITGTLKATVTNLDSGESIDVEASGPGTFPLDELRVIGEGNWIFFLMPGQGELLGLPDLFTTSGHIDFTIDENGVFQTFELKGTMTDLCELLA
jgi:hypothetical protein